MTDPVPRAVTLLLLLSMSKLQKGQEHAAQDVRKRWQTPASLTDAVKTAMVAYSKNTALKCLLTTEI